MRTEAVRRWEEMELAVQRSEWEFLETETETDTSAASADKVIVRRVRGKFMDDLFLIQVEWLDANRQSAGSRSIYARNHRYGFLLDRVDESGGESPWMVTWAGTARGIAIPVESAQTNFGGMLRLPWSISAVPLRNLVANQRFGLSASSTRNVGGRDCIDVSFVISPGTDGNGQVGGITRGTMVLDPERQWAVVEYSAEYESKLTDVVRLDYTIDGPPFLKHVDFQLVKASSRVDRFDVEVLRYGACDASEDEFTLPAFGLPDYREPLARRPVFRWAVTLLGVGCILCAYCLRRSRSRFRQDGRTTV